MKLVITLLIKPSSTMDLLNFLKSSCKDSTSFTVTAVVRCKVTLIQRYVQMDARKTIYIYIIQILFSSQSVFAATWNGNTHSRRCFVPAHPMIDDDKL